MTMARCLVAAVLLLAAQPRATALRASPPTYDPMEITLDGQAYPCQVTAIDKKTGLHTVSFHYGPDDSVEVSNIPFYTLHKTTTSKWMKATRQLVRTPEAMDKAVGLARKLAKRNNLPEAERNRLAVERIKAKAAEAAVAEMKREMLKNPHARYKIMMKARNAKAAADAKVRQEMAEVQAASTFTLEYRAHQKNETGDSCNYKENVGATATGIYGVTCCGANSVCEDPVPGTCTMATVAEAERKCWSEGLELCRDSRLCSNCKQTKCYTDGVKILGLKSYVSR